jgi:hypothetical protein
MFIYILAQFGSPSKEEVQMAKMLNIPGHKENANQNHFKIPPHSC